MKAFKKAISIILRISISICLLIFLFRHIDEKSLLQTIKRADLVLVFLSFCILFASYVLCLLRWEMLLKALDIHLPLKRVVMSFSGGIFFSLFMPSTIGGDLMRTLDLAAHTRRPRDVVATVFLDRLSGYVGLVLFALLSLAAGWRLLQDKSVLLALAIISGLLACVLLVLFNSFIYTKINKMLHSPNAGRVRQVLKDLHQEIHLFKQHKQVIVSSIFLSLLVQSAAPLGFYCIAKALGLQVPIIYFFVFLPIIGAITLLPISIGGLGLRDVTTIYFFAKAGVDKHMAFAMSLLNFSFIAVIGVLGGIIYVLTIHHRRLQHHKS